MVTSASSAASGSRLYAEASASARACRRVSVEMPFSRSRTCNASMSSKFIVVLPWSSATSSPCAGAAPLALAVHAAGRPGQLDIDDLDGLAREERLDDVADAASCAHRAHLLSFSPRLKQKRGPRPRRAPPG